MADEQIDYDDDEYGGGHKMQYQGGGAIPALADEELMGEDDEYDDLYNDVNVGGGFFQLHQAEASLPPASAGNGGYQTQKTEVHESRAGAGLSQELSIGPIAVKGPEGGPVGYPDGPSTSQKGRAMEIAPDGQVRNMGFQGSSSVPPKMGVEPSNMPAKPVNEPVASLNSATGAPQGVPPMSANQMGMNMNVNRPMVNENQIRPPVEGGGTMLFVGELHWWTTDAELENVLSQYGRVKEIKFFDERASGKSKGYCQVEFFDQEAASVCKEGMNGYMFNGRACVVAFASPQTLKQMGASYVNKNQAQPQTQPQGRRNDGGGRGANMNYQGGDGGRSYGRGGWGRGGQGMMNRGPGGGPMRGRGGAKNLGANAAGASGGGYGPGLAGPGFGGPAGGFMHPHGMMGVGFDPTYMGRGGGYGGFPSPAFPGMMPSFPGVNTMGLAGVAPHVNPNFFGRGMAPNAMSMMGSSAMDGQHAGMWSDMSMTGWGSEEQGRRTRESSYGGEDGASEYGYGEVNNERPAKERPSERDWSENSERRNRDEREQDRDRPERVHREHRVREEKDGYRDHHQRERDSGYEDDRDRGQSSRSRRVMQEDDNRSRSRDADYGKRRRLPSE